MTDSNNGAVFQLVGGALEPLALTMPVYQPNGIASDVSQGRLYVAHAGGVVVHDFATGRSRELAAAATLIGGVDGMVWHQESLIGVQNLANAGIGNRLLRITPDTDAQMATIDVLLTGSDFPGSATTVAVARGEAFVIGRTTGASGAPVEPFLIRAPLQ